MKTTSITVSVVSILLLVLTGSSATADSGKENSFKARLSGFHEVPAISIAGTGHFRAHVDETETSLTFELRYSDLQAAPTAAHVHLGQAGVNGGVMYFLCGGSKPACPNPPAVITGTVTASDIVGPSGQGIAAGEFAEVLRAMRRGVTYANVHTSSFPGGEIRGQVKDHWGKD